MLSVFFCQIKSAGKFPLGSLLFLFFRYLQMIWSFEEPSVVSAYQSCCLVDLLWRANEQPKLRSSVCVGPFFIGDTRLTRAVG